MTPIHIICLLVGFLLGAIAMGIVAGAKFNDKEWSRKLKTIDQDRAECPSCGALLRVGKHMNVTRYCDCCGQRVLNDRVTPR